MQILVCGASGQLGQELLSRGVRHGHRVIGLAHRELDIANRAQVVEVVRRQAPQLIVNAAAFTGVDQAETDVADAYAVNRDGVGHLASTAAELGIPLFHVSTDYVFRGDGDRPYTEADATAPQGVYGASKLAGEQLLQASLAEHVILRTSWVFSEYGHNFVKTMLRLGAQRDSLSVVDDQIGCPTHAGALADALLQLASRYAEQGSLAWGVYHYSGTPACSWYGFAKEIFRHAAEQGLLERAPVLTPISTADYPTPARRPAWSVLDCSRFEQTFGLAMRPWQEGLQEVVEVLGRRVPEPA